MVELQRAEQRSVAAGRSPDRLLRDAWAIRHLLEDLDADDHITRTRLLVARDEVRLEAAQQWHARGWRPITEEF